MGAVFLGVVQGETAHSGDRDHLFRSIVITGSGDLDHPQGNTVRPERRPHAECCWLNALWPE
jgi:hypothetical protein